ncbi:nucleoside-diphosphate sugar epimerase/dehydratase [Kiloniella laminariae]|uniref:Nucleoside-diphosphate sugar epimerase/dehydratase n=1 Tax=Kiloniella laminariae TaxID=454162 RepID=A0ABT4LJ40_9PROT|nr:nucleoside-diphosphate sugar epimerase/dehydratase [Kiloniella laminariae]MCZ4281113.1 nucleoside-diphosphate sugar epimerase/dehydratase [Kiloniella laminariae]
MRLQATPRFKSLVAFVHDLIMVAISFALALALRTDVTQPVLLPSGDLLPTWGFFIIVGAFSFWLLGFYKGIWRYASMNDLFNIIKAATLIMLIFVPVLFFWNRLEDIPRSSLIINWFILIFLLGAPRMLYRIWKDQGFRRIMEKNSHLRIPVFLIGADDLAEAFVRHISRDPGSLYEVVGILDPSGKEAGRRIHDIPVAGPLEKLETALKVCSTTNRAPQRLVISTVLEREVMQFINAIAEKQALILDRLPNPTEFKSSNGENIEVRPIAIEDLLGRKQATLDRQGMRDLISDRRVLITGCGGSIGSELARQIASFGPAHLILLDSSEYNLYSIDLEIDENFPNLKRDAIIGDVRDRSRLEQVFERFKPELVFHAAALKHVPLVEANPVEGVHTNTLGTRNTADACRKAGVKTMVLISTDKAINPPNVMGASKRLAESYCQALDIAGRDEGKTRFVTVRFGNVLGSTGSVVPLFERQLRAGGPLTVTHPDITRYFMTIREAVELVLQTMTLGAELGSNDAGKIYVLDMGDPVKIVDLAKQVIRLGGFEPDQEVMIEYTGLRPGEKLYEELFHESEPLLPTNHNSLKLASPRTADLEFMIQSLDHLSQLIQKRDRPGVIAQLRRLVPEYNGQQPQDRDLEAAASHQ